MHRIDTCFYFNSTKVCDGGGGGGLLDSDHLLDRATNSVLESSSGVLVVPVEVDPIVVAKRPIFDLVLERREVLHPFRIYFFGNLLLAVTRGDGGKGGGSG